MEINECKNIGKLTKVVESILNYNLTMNKLYFVLYCCVAVLSKQLELHNCIQSRILPITKNAASNAMSQWHKMLLVSFRELE